MLEIILVAVAFVLASFIAILYLIFHDMKKYEYKVKEESQVEKEAEEKYLEEFPDYTSFRIKSEIEKIADILIDNQSSNRYTEVLREKAANDDKIKDLKNAVVEDVDIMKYNKGNMKAKLKYKDYDYNYSMILNLSTVSRGRVFLNNYLVYKERIAS